MRSLQNQKRLRNAGQVISRIYSYLLNVDTQGNDDIGESRLEDSVDIKEITEDEAKRVADRSRNGKAPGCDINPNEIYKTGNKVMICRLTKLFNTAYSTGRIPEEWGKADMSNIETERRLSEM